MNKKVVVCVGRGASEIHRRWSVLIKDRVVRMIAAVVDRPHRARHGDDMGDLAPSDVPLDVIVSVDA